MTQQAALLTTDGTPVPGYLHEAPGDGKAGAVVIIPEWWGLNGHIRDVADRFAREGFTAFAVDVYDGRTTRDAAEAEALLKAMDPQRALAMIRLAVEALRRRGQRVGVVGFCMGGALALATAAHDEKLDACVPFYGIPQEARADVTRIRAPVLGHYAQHDDHCAADRVDALERKLAGAGIAATLHRYDAHHAFFNDTRPQVYSPENAGLAWRRTVDFLHEKLGERAARPG
ncbi:dienelactone hydrolase family protein [Myxococcaceae bacterium GXIMD 01537]